MSNHSDKDLGCAHFTQFAKALSLKIKKDHIGSTDVVSQDFIDCQKEQVELLNKLEDDLRLKLLSTAKGRDVYLKFVDFIRNDRRNILDARPYFRERQQVFTDHIATALKARHPEGIYDYHFNFLFAAFAIKQLPDNKALNKIFTKIKAIRNKLIEVNTPLAIARSSMFFKKTPKGHLSRMDMIQVAMEGLISGIDKYVCPYEPDQYRHMLIGRILGNNIEEFSLDGDTMLNPVGQSSKPIKDFVAGDKIDGVDTYGNITESEVLKLHDHGILEAFEVTFDNGYKVTCSAPHKFLTKYGMVPLKDIISKGLEIYCEPTKENKWLDGAVRREISDQEDLNDPSSRLYSMQGGIPRNKNKGHGGSTLQSAQGWRLEESLWNDLLEKKGFVDTSKGLSGLPQTNEREKGGWCNRLEREVSRKSEGTLPYSRGGVQAMETGQSRGGVKIKYKNIKRHEKMVCGTPRRKGQNNSQPTLFKEGVGTGKISKEWNSTVGVNSGSMWGGQEAGGLCVTGPQNTSRGGRMVALQCPQKDAKGYGTVYEQTTQGRHPKRGDFQKEGYHADPVISEMLHFDMQNCKMETKARMGGLAYAHAPLTSTGNLVLRRIIRVRYVGQKHMYDLEVSHPKHNFCLPNGIVTSNSATTVHFYPSDKRKLYNANKVVRSCESVDSFDEIASKVNGLAKQKQYRTDPNEINHLMAAANTVQADFNGNLNTGPVSAKANIQNTTQYADDIANRPDSRYESLELTSELSKAARFLTPFEQKILKLKGIEV
jgi:hypothetical protein